MGKIAIIIKREFLERVRKKSFIISTLLTPLLFVGMIVAMFFLMKKSTSEVRKVMVYDQSQIVAPHLESSATIKYEITDQSLDEFKIHQSNGEYEGVFGILIIGDDILDNSRNLELYTYSPSTIEVEMAISNDINGILEAEKLKRYDIENLPQILDEVKTSVTLRSFRVGAEGSVKESSSALAMAFAYIFGFLIYMFIFMYGAMVMQGVIEEKSSKVLEIMVSSVKPFEMMMGKILGIASVAITQFVIWVVLIFVGSTVVMSFFAGDAAAMAEGGNMMMDGGMGAMGGMDPEAFAAINTLTDFSFIGKMLGGFIVYFLGGYLLYAAMFAAIGSAVENTADTQQLQLPVTIPMILAIVILMNVMRDPNSSLAVWSSIIPFTSPIIMVARLPYSVPTWEIVVSLVVLFATFIFMVWVASKIYRVGIFMYGKKPTFKELYKWARYKY